MNSMSSMIENGLQRQAALPHFWRISTDFFTEFNSPKIKSLKFWITELFTHFLKLWIGNIFDDNLPNLTALYQLTAKMYRFS